MSQDHPHSKNRTTTNGDFLSELNLTADRINNAHRHLTTALGTSFAQLLPPAKLHDLHQHRHRLYTLRRNIKKIANHAATLRRDEIEKLGYSLESSNPSETSPGSPPEQVRQPNRSK